MIEIRNVTKRFDKTTALDGISLVINEGSVFGLVGSNGAGKSTLLRLLSGVYSADRGCIFIDGEEPYENIELKRRIAFVSDHPYFDAVATLENTAKSYRLIYPSFSRERYESLKNAFSIEPKKRILSMSKGVQRQAAIILALSCEPEFIFFDEIFDGLDAVVRERVKKILIGYVLEKKATVVIASHNLRELEGFCDHIGLLHKGGVLLERDINCEDIGLCRVQFIMKDEEFDGIRGKLDIVKENKQGSMTEITVRGNADEVDEIIRRAEPLFCEALPLTLEELFIAEMEVAGYEIKEN